MALTESTELKACGIYIDLKEQQWLVEFLTILHSDFKGLRGLILHHSPLPSVNCCQWAIGWRNTSSVLFWKWILSASNPFILAVPFKLFFNHQNKPYTRIV